MKQWREIIVVLWRINYENWEYFKHILKSYWMQQKCDNMVRTWFEKREYWHRVASSPLRTNVWTLNSLLFVSPRFNFRFHFYYVANCTNIHENWLLRPLLVATCSSRGQVINDNDQTHTPHTLEQNTKEKNRRSGKKRTYEWTHKIYMANYGCEWWLHVEQVCEIDKNCQESTFGLACYMWNVIFIPFISISMHPTSNW